MSRQLMLLNMVMMMVVGITIVGGCGISDKNPPDNAIVEAVLNSMPITINRFTAFDSYNITNAYDQVIDGETWRVLELEAFEYTFSGEGGDFSRREKWTTDYSNMVAYMRHSMTVAFIQRGNSWKEKTLNRSNAVRVRTEAANESEIAQYREACETCLRAAQEANYSMGIISQASNKFAAEIAKRNRHVRMQ